MLEPPTMKSWPHAPPHWNHEPGIYFITAATYGKEHYFKEAPRLDLLTDLILATLAEASWSLDAWAIFPNHYHLIVRSSPASKPLSRVLGKIHMLSSKEINRIDGAMGRKVWHNFWDTPITFERSHWARLHYVIHNPVHHGLALRSGDYPWCSAAWFEKHASPAFVEVVRSFPIDRLEVEDDF